MVKQEDFEVERWMDKYETQVKCNIAETCCAPVSIAEMELFCGEEFPTNQLRNTVLNYGTIPGSEETRTLVAELVNTPSGGPISVTKDNVILTNGAIGANFLVYYALCQPGDSIIVVDPAYGQLHSVPAMFGSSVHRFKLRFEDDYQPDLQELEKMVRKIRPKVININSPHNPTGTHTTEEDLLKIVELAKLNDSYLLADEVYRPLFHSTSDDPKSVANLYQKAVVTGSTSKAFSMAGLRTGWVVSPDAHVLEECMKRRDYNIISVGKLDDLVTGWLLKNKAALLDRNYHLCRQNLKLVSEYRDKLNGKISYVEPTAGTTMLIKIDGEPNTIKFCHELAIKKSVLLVPGETFGVPGTVRLGFANDPKELKTGLDLLYEFLTGN